MRIVNDEKIENRGKNKDLGKWRIWFRQLGILIRKNFLLQIRRPVATIFSCLVGLILAFLLIGRNESKYFRYNSTRWLRSLHPDMSVRRTLYG